MKVGNLFANAQFLLAVVPWVSCVPLIDRTCIVYGHNAYLGNEVSQLSSQIYHMHTKYSSTVEYTRNRDTNANPSEIGPINRVLCLTSFLSLLYLMAVVGSLRLGMFNEPGGLRTLGDF